MPHRDTSLAQPSDRILVERLRSGNPDALQELIQAFWLPLVGFAGRILAGTADPEDAVQDAFVRLWAKRESLKREGSLRSFLYTIVRNACLDELRRSGRRRSAEDGSAPPSPSQTPYQDVQGAELERAAAAAVTRLPAKRQEVFRLAREEGLSYQEISEVMSISPQTVANHMSLAMADLRTALKPFLSQELMTDGMNGSSSNEHPSEG